MNLTGRRDITLESALHDVGRRNVYRIAGLERRLYFSLQSPSCALVGSSCGTFGALAGGGTCCTDPIIGVLSIRWDLSVLLSAANLGLDMQVHTWSTDPSMQLLT